MLHTTKAGLEQASHHYRERLNVSAKEIADSTRLLAVQIQRIEKLHRHLIWKTVGAPAVCFALPLAGGIWLSMHYTSVIERSKLSAQWMEPYNKADVTLCEGRVCAHVDPTAKRFGTQRQ